jgi:hypothetical protein
VALINKPGEGAGKGESFGAALVALAGRLNQEEAENLCAPVASDLLKGIGGRGHQFDDSTERVATALVILSKRLSAKEARQTCATAARGVVDAMQDRTEDQEFLRKLLLALTKLAEALESKDAVEVASRLLTQLSQRGFSGDDYSAAGGPELVAALMALSERMGEQEAIQFVGRAFADACRLDRRKWWLPSLTEGFARRFSEQGLVSLLKGPFCTGRVRETILAELGKRTGQTFRSRWDFVDWAAANRPDLDLTSPYRPHAE